ncbi:secreted RxLR effector protein 161-like [Solanum verrucosum]|uniref:secreted RxLR effector protein 161-like n=1 Tax=Solanum verrucosum TaxID=315347 RepID=UPI0020D041A3|nr:secreted RxLR effector protein 161-like [Solanum verrucosum]
MVVISLDINKDPFRPQEKDEELLGAKTPYLSAIGALMYLANNIRPDFCSKFIDEIQPCPTRRHWKCFKHIFRYLQGTIDMGLLYSNASKSELIGYADAGYLSDPHKARSQTGYLFIYGGTTIS